MGGGAFVERPDFVHDGNETALSDELEDCAQFVPGAHVRAEDRKLAGEEETDIEFGIRAGGGTTGDQTSAGGQALEAFAEGGFADVFEDDIDTVIVGKAANFLGNRHDAVMNDFIRAKLLGFGDFVVVSGGGDNTAGKEFGDLDGGAANTTAGREDEDVLARLQLGAIHKHVPGGLKHNRNSGGMGPIQVFGIGHAIDVRATDIFGAAAIHHVAEVGIVAAAVFIAGKASGTFAASDAGRENHFLADVDGTDFRSDFGDFAGDVAARDVRKGGLETGEAAAHPEVKMIESAGVDTNEDFTTAELRLGDIGVMKNGRVTVFLEDDGFHEEPPGSEMK